jgi:hypothetical protein
MSKRKAAQADATAADQITDDVGEFPPSDTETAEPKAQRKYNPVRSWSHRIEGPARYEVLTDSRINKIIIKLKLNEGEKTPAEDVLAIMRAAKVNGDGSSTGLRFEDSRLHGKVWTLPNDPEGRAILAGIEMKLEELGAKATTPEQSAR